MKLDVGCGDRKTPGAIGIDSVPLEGVDIVHNLTDYPWPVESGSCDEVYLLNILEHLPNPIGVMEEVHRVLKVGGKCYIEVVYWNHQHSVSDPQHVAFFNEVSWEFFTGQRKGYYTTARFRMEHFEYIFDQLARRILISTWLMRKLGRYLCNVIQGMYVTLVKV